MSPPRRSSKRAADQNPVTSYFLPSNATSSSPVSKKQKMIENTISSAEIVPTLNQTLPIPSSSTLYPLSAHNGTTEPFEVRFARVKSIAALPNAEKPLPVGEPPVWSKYRNTMCETLDYFRAYQSGTSSKGELYRGSLIAGTTYPGDWQDANRIISRHGGCSGKQDGKSGLIKSQKWDLQSTAFQRLIDDQIPIPFIVGSDYEGSICQLPSDKPFSVMGHFLPQYMWMARQGKHNIIRYSLRRLPDQPAWWNGQGLPTLDDVLPPPQELECATCCKSYLQVYTAWMCLNEKCAEFCKVSGTQLDCAVLEYNPHFLCMELPTPIPQPTEPLVPHQFVPSTGENYAFNLAVRATKGNVCPTCRQCVGRSRLVGKAWECDNPDCNYSITVPQGVLTGPNVTAEQRPLLYNGQARCNDVVCQDLNSPITIRKFFDGAYTYKRYDIPGTDSFVVHIAPNRSGLEGPARPHDLFESLQKEDVGMKRRFVGPHRGHTAKFTAQFSTNVGLPYNYVAAEQNINESTTSFAESPQVLHDAFAGCNNWGKVAVGDGYLNCNEMLALGYLEKNKIGYHSDGEETLGPTIITLSLGHVAQMKLRMKEKYWQGYSDKNVYADKKKPVPNCCNYEERLKAWETIASIQADPSKLQAKKIEEIQAIQAATVASSKKAKKSLTLFLDMELNHGDVVIMHGEPLQEFFEHGVEPKGNMRFALTTRHILPHKVQNVLPDGFDASIPTVQFTHPLASSPGQGFADGVNYPKWLHPDATSQTDNSDPPPTEQSIV
ncbi:hypothetical protein BT63DRAFT_66628 [Microthyrium microscopicum]|uniref:Alpha-ketoglutarate-dependent dioxygenase AlkB-like domain-containing protein n=1 Tax=Microthyrium microscopicum TaxID=703497 RepID=A0A6A6TZF3_9PEZI|nr:hypothetical protein BT63DRAFT_66628 [Microthyrium microscopicum]